MKLWEAALQVGGLFCSERINATGGNPGVEGTAMVAIEDIFGDSVRSFGQIVKVNCQVEISRRLEHSVAVGLGHVESFTRSI